MRRKGNRYLICAVGVHDENLTNLFHDVIAVAVENDLLAVE
jgi:hypothetical protein